MNKKYIVTLTADERQSLEALLKRGRVAARKVKRAWILLKADVGPQGPRWSDEQIQQAFDVGLMTIYRTRQTLVEEGLSAVLTPRPPARHRPRKLDGDQEAQLIALACSQPPPGRRRWTVRLLAKKFVELGYSEPLSPETVRQTLKKTSSGRTW
jgi:transposase